MFNKKMSDLTVGESLKLSAIVTAVCFIPTVVYLVHDWYQDVQYRRRVSDFFKEKLKKEEEEQ